MDILQTLVTISHWLHAFQLPSFVAQSGAAAVSGIEGLYGQKFGEAIFYFLLFSIILFTVIVIAFLFLGKKKLKTGEKVLFGWIFLGIVVAVFFGAAQMLHGFLF